MQLKLAANNQETRQFDQIKQKKVHKMGSRTILFFSSVHFPCFIKMNWILEMNFLFL